MQNIYQSISAALADIEAIGKNQRNKDQGFMYRGIDDIYNDLHPILAKHKIFAVPEVLERTAEPFTVKSGAVWSHVVLKVKYTFFAEDGSSVSAVVVGEGRDSSDKGSNKALSIAHKYALVQVFCIPTLENIDPDSETVEGFKGQIEPPKSKPAKEKQPDKKQPEKEMLNGKQRGNFDMCMKEIANATIVKQLDAIKIAIDRRGFTDNELETLKTSMNAKFEKMKETNNGLPF